MTHARVIAFGLPAAAIAAALWDPARNGGPPLCPFRACTGVDCPGCGLTRATGALLRGRFGDAMHLHPLVLVVGVQVAVLWAFAVVAARHPDRAARTPPTWVTPVILMVNASLFLAVWGVRLASGTLPSA